MEPVIIFRNVYKSYMNYNYIKAGLKSFVFKLPTAIRHTMRRHTVLEDISFEVYRGECVGFLGRNGAGKSTILALIAGVLKPDRGQIVVKGKVVPLLELGTGFHPELTGLENILLNGVLLGNRMKEVASKIDDIVQFSELDEETILQPVRTYSSGMLARLAFSIAVNLEPEILLVDEVLAVGDIWFQNKCLEKVKSLKARGTTIVLVSHVIEHVEMLCDRAIWIENHRIKMIGDAKKVCAEYKNG